jgi:hypothetical protein
VIVPSAGSKTLKVEMRGTRRFAAITHSLVIAIIVTILSVSLAGPARAADNQWPYSVTVCACAGGQKAQKLATADPRIVWND